MKHTSLAALTCASLLGSAALSQAALISVNFAGTTFSPNTGSSATPTGAAVIGGAADTWNDLRGDAGTNISSLGTVALNTTTGAASGASLSVSTGAFNGSATSPSSLAVFQGGIYLDGNGEYGPSGPATITLTGLGAGAIVDLYLYSGNGGGQGATFTFGSAQSVSDNPSNSTSYSLGDNYTLFSGLVANGSGTITGTWAVNSGASQRFSSLDGLQVNVIPEPSTAALGLLASGGLLLRRRRA